MIASVLAAAAGPAGCGTLGDKREGIAQRRQCKDAGRHLAIFGVIAKEIHYHLVFVSSLRFVALANLSLVFWQHRVALDDTFDEAKAYAEANGAHRFR